MKHDGLARVSWCVFVDRTKAVWSQWTINHLLFVTKEPVRSTRNQRETDPISYSADSTMELQGIVFLTVLVNVIDLSVEAPIRETSSSGFIDYYPGTLNVVMAVPHGGAMKPDSIPDRRHGCWDASAHKCRWIHADCGERDSKKCRGVIEEDWNTQKLALLLRDEIKAQTGEYPHVIMNNLHRIKLDANRDKPDAAFGVPLAEQAWTEFHQYIDRAKTSISGRGLFLDIHGHGHPNNWVELGYLIKKDLLNSGEFDANSTSIRRLASEVNGTFEDLLRGPFSLGRFLQDNRFSAVPSPNNPAPGENKYFSGGFNTRRHGSITSGNIDAIQIESSRNQRSDSTRPQYTRSLAKALKSFLDTHYKRDDEGNSAATLGNLFNWPIYTLGYVVLLRLHSGLQA